MNILQKEDDFYGKVHFQYSYIFTYKKTEYKEQNSIHSHFKLKVKLKISTSFVNFVQTSFKTLN